MSYNTRSVPCLVIPASIAFIIVDDRIKVVEALYVIPSAMLLNAFALIIWKFTPPFFAKRNLSLTKTILLSMFLSLLIWSLGGFALYFILEPLSLFAQRIIAGVSIFIMLIFGLFAAIRQPIPTSDNQFKMQDRLMYLAMFVLAFISIGFSVVLSPTSEIISGILVSFPSFITVSMINYWTFQGTASRGKEFITVSVGRVYISHMCLGTLSISVYCILFAAIYELEFFEDWNRSPGDFIINLGIACTASFFVALIGVTAPVLLLLKVIQHKAENRLSYIPHIDETSALNSFSWPRKS